MTKKKADETPTDPAPVRPTSYRPAPDVHRAMNEYRDGFEFKPSYSDIIDRALRMYLRSKGFKGLPEEPTV